MPRQRSIHGQEKKEGGEHEGHAWSKKPGRRQPARHRQVEEVRYRDVRKVIRPEYKR